MPTHKDSPAPLHPLHGNLLYDYASDPAALVQHRQALAVARDESIGQILSQHSVLPHGELAAWDAYTYYEEAHRAARDYALLLAASFSPAAWLWHLRRVPLFFFSWEQPTTASYLTSDVAEALSGESHNTGGQEVGHEPLLFRLDGAILAAILRYCGAVQVLRKVHQRIRTAGKGIRFVSSTAGELPAPAPTTSQREALQYYDSRTYGFPFLRGTGTLVAEFGSGDNAVLYLTKDFAPQHTIPYADSDPQLDRLLQVTLHTRTADQIRVPTKFALHELSLSGLSRLGVDHLPQSARNNVFCLLALLRLTRAMVFEGNPAYGMLQVAQKGYLVDRPESFLARFERTFDAVCADVQQIVEPQDPPASAVDLLSRLRRLEGEDHPVTYGRILRHARRSVLVDVYGASMRLERELSFERSTGALANDRAYHFENAVQRVIDETPWGANLPVAVRNLRTRKRLRRASGEPLTDLDALGARDGTLLLVDCKSMLGGPILELGRYNDARNQARRVEEYVRAAESVAGYLRANPIGPGGSYDVSDWTNIQMVVCTPTPVYTELELVRHAGMDVQELRSTREILPGLHAAVSIAELASWLSAEHSAVR